MFPEPRVCPTTVVYDRMPAGVERLVTQDQDVVTRLEAFDGRVVGGEDFGVAAGAGCDDGAHSCKNEL